MLCRISDLYVEVPEAGGMAPRCREYVSDQQVSADIILDAAGYRYEKFPKEPELAAYLESGFQFYRQLIRFDGMMLHASAVVYRNRAYLFSGHCGVGKSTHTGLWRQVFGEAAQIINDDKPALRYVDGTWYAYGTPWCGKDGINCNRKVPVAGICFLMQSHENTIQRLQPKDALIRILSQTPCRIRSASDMDMLLRNVEKLIMDIPVFELRNRPEPEAALLAYAVMCDTPQED